LIGANCKLGEGTRAVALVYHLDDPLTLRNGKDPATIGVNNVIESRLQPDANGFAANFLEAFRKEDPVQAPHRSSNYDDISTF